MSLPVWSHVLSRGVYDATSCLVPCSFGEGGLCPVGVSVQDGFCVEGGLPAGVCLPPPVNRQTGVKTLPSLAVGNNIFTVVL